MTEHGSSPGRPRGRRARQDGNAPEWQGFDGTPQDQREFPDLAPIRPKEARARDGRLQSDWRPQGPQGQPGGYQGGGYQGAGYGGDQYGGGGYPAGGYPVPGYGDQGQQGGQQGHAPWDGQAQAGQAGQAGYPASAQPQSAQPQSAQPQSPVEPQSPPQFDPASQFEPTAQFQPTDQTAQSAQPGKQRRPEPEEDVPSWAEPDSVEAFSERWHRRGLDSRDDRRGSRRTRRRLLIAGGTAIALVIAATVYLLEGGPGAANLGFGSFVTTFLPGELQQVPDACTMVPQSMLTQNLPGTLKQAEPPLNTGQSSQCTWTLDHAPTYKVLQASLNAFSPSGLASGDGSATFAAEDAYQSDETGFQNPGPKSDQPTATVTDLTGMPGGTDTSAFMATQVFSRGGAITDVVHVLVRYRNVIVTIVVDGLDKSSPGTKTYGPVQMSDLVATGKQVAQEVASQIVK